MRAETFALFSALLGSEPVRVDAALAGSRSESQSALLSRLRSADKRERARLIASSCEAVLHDIKAMEVAWPF